MSEMQHVRGCMIHSDIGRPGPGFALVSAERQRLPPAHRELADLYGEFMALGF